MKTGRMFLAQSRMNSVIMYCVLVDVVMGYVLKRFHGPSTVLPLALLYLLNIVVIAAVYRFWKVPIFEWDEKGFVLYGISPFKKERGSWLKVEKAGFKLMEDKKGKGREYLLIIFENARGARRTGMVPMDMVGFRDRVKEDLLELLKEKGVNPL